jgi:drug/metabolite transporter (DMT)-like permease
MTAIQSQSSKWNLIFSFSLLLILDVLSLLFEKVASINASGQDMYFFLSLPQKPWMWIAIAIGPGQLLIWKYILGKTELSLAYPLTSLCYPLTMLVSVLFLGEHLDFTVWIGGFLITVGVTLLNVKTKGKVHETA